METKASFARNGELLKLPPGFRFHPTDEELVVQYLKRKVFSCPLPAAIIPDIDLAKFDPWEIPGGCEEERYLFNHRETKYQNCNRTYRAAKSGYWKATGKDSLIVSSRSNQVVGMKKVLVFFRGKPPMGSRTDYILHEYRLAGSESTPCIFPLRKNSSPHSLIVPNGDWVLCRIFKKKRVARIRDNEIDEDIVKDRSRNKRTLPNDFISQQNRYRNLDSSLATESSCVTELFDNCGSEEETSPAP